MIRRIDEFVAGIEDSIGLGVAVLLLFLAAALIGAGWYFWPSWLPSHWRRRTGTGSGRRWRWPTLRRPRWRWPWRRRKAEAAEPLLEPHETEGLPDLPVETFVSLADRLAADGRYAEAVRERLRGIVRELVDAGIVEHRPGYTITELAATASRNRPAVRIPLDAASLLFSDIWYGQRPATAAHDAHMRRYAAQVHAELVPVGVGS